jgi:hypothetical protein
MFSQILRIPEEFAESQTPETVAYVQKTVARDFAAFEVKYLRKHVLPDE